MGRLQQLLPGYAPCTFDYGRDDGNSLPTYRDWIQVFRKSIPTFRTHALTDVTVPEDKREDAAARFASSFGAALDALLADPSAPAPGHPDCHPLNCYNLCKLREECLHAAGFTDIFRGVKAAEGERALALLPQLLSELDARDDIVDTLELALRGVFAGNIFDLGAEASAQQYAAGGSAFATTRDQLVPRPWAVDHLDSLLAHVRAGGRWRKAALFVDNAGPDVVLGMLPFARVLLKLGAEVLLVANRGATINDITAAELSELLPRAADADRGVLGAAVAAGWLRVVCSGSDMPVIDLEQVSDELVEATADCDLIVLEGMGRAIETNLHARFTCDSLKLGMIKHPEVATCLNGRMYDCVCKYDRGEVQGAAVGEEGRERQGGAEGDGAGAADAEGEGDEGRGKGQQ